MSRQTISLCFFIAIVLFGGAAWARDADRDWSVADSIAVRYLKPPEREHPDNFVSVSPDGARFLVMTSSGDLTRDIVINDILVYAADDLDRALARNGARPQPLRKFRVESSFNNGEAEPVNAIRWESNDSILFAGAQRTDDYGIYRYSVATGELSRLTPGEQEVFPIFYGLGWANVGITGRSLVYSARDLTRNVPQSLELARYPFSEVSGSSIQQLLLSLLARRNGVPFELFSSFNRTARSVAKLEYGSRLMGTWMSNDGARAIVAIAPESPAAPETWASYEKKLTQQWYRYMLVDVARGTCVPVIDAPSGRAATTIGNGSPLRYNALWSYDSTHVVLS